MDDLISRFPLQTVLCTVACAGNRWAGCAERGGNIWGCIWWECILSLPVVGSSPACSSGSRRGCWVGHSWRAGLQPNVPYHAAHGPRMAQAQGDPAGAAHRGLRLGPGGGGHHLLDGGGPARRAGCLRGQGTARGCLLCQDAVGGRGVGHAAGGLLEGMARPVSAVHVSSKGA